MSKTPERALRWRAKVPTTGVHIRVPNPMYDALEDEMERTGHDRSTVIRDAIRFYLELEEGVRDLPGPLQAFLR